MVDPANTNGMDLISVQSALVRNGAFTVIDRSDGFQSIKREQNNLHILETNRYDNREKFAHYGRMFGVGAVIVAKAQCRTVPSFWIREKMVRQCDLFLHLVDANTGEIISAAKDKEETPDGQYPTWDRIVSSLVDNYPRDFRPSPIKKPLLDYKADTEKRSTQNVIKWELPHDDEFDSNGKAIPPEEVLKRHSKQLKAAGVSN